MRLMHELRLHELRLPLDHPEAALRSAAAARLRLPEPAITSVHVARKGFDARKRSAVTAVYSLDVGLRDLPAQLPEGVHPTPDTSYRLPPPPRRDYAERPVVIGAGPCGLFAALVLAQAGYRPILLERGKPVRARTVDTFALWRRGVLTPESNVQFGEGGAGTFSDGKLWSGISDPQHLGRKVLEEFVAAGAPPEILYVSKPHIGTFRLVSMVEHMRATIEALGGEYRFETRVTGLDLDDARAVRGVFTTGGRIAARHVVLAMGHSSRDTAETLLADGVAMDAKPFSIGVRIEHPQGLIDRARHGVHAGHPALGAADYKLVHHCATVARSAYSFCMCPGGQVVAAASEPGRVVTNGMSQYSRAERNANAGLVVGVTPADFTGGPLGGIALQRHWEERAFAEGGGDYRAPGQTVGDFLAGRPSRRLGSVVPSYQPGVRPADLSRCLPDFVIAALREAIPAFARKIPGYDLSDAVMTGVETRTSSPIRLPRGPDRQSTNTPGLFPAGEGAGFAGGILSAGVDGIGAAEAVVAAIRSAVSPPPWTAGPGRAAT